MVSFMTLAFVNLDISGGGGGGGGGIRPPSQLIPQKPGMNRVKKAPSIYSRRALDDVLIKLTHTLVRQQRGPGKFFNINCLIWDTSNRS